MVRPPVNTWPGRRSFSILGDRRQPRDQLVYEEGIQHGDRYAGDQRAGQQRPPVVDVAAYQVGGYGDTDRFLRRIGHEGQRSEEHTSEIQTLLRLTYDVFCLKKQT